MTPLDLWLPVLLASVAVFLVSSLIHMVLQWHNGDFDRLAGEERILALLREEGVEAGQYMFPCAKSMAEFQTPEHQEKVKLGPLGVLIVRSGYSMGKSLGQWFLFTVLVSAFVAYLAAGALEPGAAASAVFCFTLAVALLGYAFSSVQESIWKGLSWCTTVRFFADGVAYGAATAAVFTWLWPGA
ncbi:MAG: hypothetical protein QF903_09980 [Planctomycetota bacterium]|jgi:hypothetical protein|nr:hypothetical protein [Planctomycetota bacterium]MDP6764078.1 hypothetical protein [Planctomycetota bacterium]MDP6989794.1 hypothetical protein [Planctomycetota bacterium]